MNKEVYANLVSSIDLKNRAQDNLSRITELFKYDTLDECDPRIERIKRDVTFEIGGPCAPMASAIMTRTEHTILKTALVEIMNARIMAANRVIKECASAISEEK